MFKATHKILGSDKIHEFEAGTEVMYCEESHFEGCGVFVDVAGEKQHVLMSDVEAI